MIPRTSTWPARILLGARVAAAVVATSHLATAARRRPPLAASLGTGGGVPDITVPGITVVVPARDEETRIGPLLEALVAAPGVREVIVVDDESTDATASISRLGGARVVVGVPLPEGWAGKAWALQQGIEAATSPWIVTLDADTRPSSALPATLVARALADGIGLATVGGRFECPTAGVRWLHPAMLTTLVYRFVTPGSLTPPRRGRELANGQCMAFERERFLDAGGMTPVRGHVVEDVALARHLAATGWSVVMLDGSTLLTTRMFEDLRGAWRGWARSLALPGVEARPRQLLDLGLVLAAQASPIPRLLARRGDLLDVALVALRLGTLAGTATAYERRRLAYWSSPLADLPAAVALANGSIGRRHRWRGRDYPG